ncbi:alpha/beta hydrolase [Aeromicrobium phragmitis]|uniref:Alpha/beta hydrolase n=1 Tax=Aeromicrobium phragmitis TaxID=2478914 RepID=A0A3L8PP58_9ACTN|nr:alpha/beta hydrolase [Aeromicrobium phragmitis]RLV55782.1 alpha/beta hydrolase [Aeromicrobium phragmitis]
MRILEFDHVSLAVDEFGDRSDPSVLLIAGATQSMDWWTPKFCGVLAAEGLHVVRFDQRDTGQSTTSPPGHPSYTGLDLATDPVRILDSLGIDAAHVVGLSMGGGIAQHLAVHAAHRVRTLTLIESSPAGGDCGDLPPPAPALSAAESALPEVRDWANASAVIDYRVEAERAYAGSLGFDEERCRAIATVEFGRSRHMGSSFTNHFLVASDAAIDPSLITAPTLVVHSDTDPLFPLPHGEALARLIPDAVLLRVDGMGHEAPPPQLWGTVVPALVDHTLSRERCLRNQGLS